MNEILEALRTNGFALADYLVFGLYIVILVGMGLYLSRGKKGQEKSSKDYFLAGNTLTWWAVGASLIAANISAEQFIGMSGSAYRSGIAMAAYELMAALTLIIVAKFLLPIMIERKIFTIPQFLRERYNWGVGLAFSIFWLFLYVFINLTSVAWLGALAIKMILGLPSVHGVLLGMNVDWTMLTIILILFLVAGIYSIYGGLASVAWTDVMQVTFLVGGGLITAFAALNVIGDALHIEGGAFGAFAEIYSHLGTIEGDRHFHLIVSRNEAIADIVNDPYFDIPGIVVIVGALWISNIGYWGFNQYIIQKGLAAKNLNEAKKGMLFAASLKLLIPFIVCIPGVCAFYIMNGMYNGVPVQDMLGDALSGTIARSDDAYPFLIRNFTPVVVKGLSFAALAAAVISSLASMFNSTSTIFTMDIYKQLINKNASEKRLVNVGRITSICALLLALVAVYPIMGGADQAFQVIQEYSGFVFPGVVVIFGLGLLWKRASGVAAVVTAISTFVFSILFKFLLPDTPFLLRMGYVFACLAVLFITISLRSKKAIPAKPLDAATVHIQLIWSRVFFGVAVLCAAFGIIGYHVDALRMYGVEAIFFLATMFLVLCIYLRSNARDKVQDPQAVDIDLSLFHTEKSFKIGAYAIILMLIILYTVLW